MYAFYSDLVQDDSDNRHPIPGVTVTVRNADNTLASLYDRADIATAILIDQISNPVTTNLLGKFQFYANDNVYSAEFIQGGKVVREDKITVGDPPQYIGPPGPAFATYVLLSAFKAAAISNKVQVLQAPGITTGQFNWETANAPYTADDINVIKADSTALSVGAWVRQSSAAATFGQQGTGAVTRSAQAKLRDTVNLNDFLTGAADSTAAMQAAITSLGANGGTVEIPAGNYKANITIDQDNITLCGKGGRGEFDTVVIRPYSLASPTIRVSDGAGTHRYIALEKLHVSGSDGSADGVTKAANNAPAAVQLDGGTANFTMRQCVLYNGLKTLNLVPAASEPVTVFNDFGSTIRNDITDSANARCVYGKRLSADDDYLTAITFFGTKFNKTGSGNFMEMDGSVFPWTALLIACYADVVAGKGLLLKGGSTIRSYGSQIDPGTTGAVVIETDQAIAMGGIDAYITGSLIEENQKFKFSDVTIDIPNGSVDFSKTALHGLPFIRDGFHLTLDAAPFATDVRCLMTGTLGARTVAWTGATHTFPYVTLDNYLSVGANKVVGARGAAVANAVAAVGAPTQAEFNALVTQFNALLGRFRATGGHGLIAD